MRKLVNQLLDDNRSGIQQDASGRRYFRQRKVRFRTIHFEPAELLEGGWLEFDRDIVSPYQQSRDPSPASVKQFAQLSSERFLHFYYRVFDVAVARALATLDTNLFRLPFVVPSIFLDLGIPNEPTNGSVPPLLHERIRDQYLKSRKASSITETEYRSGTGSYEEPQAPSARNHGQSEIENRDGMPDPSGKPGIYFLSDYLEGLTDDAIALLKPYGELWELEDQLQEIHSKSKTMRKDFELLLLGSGPEQSAIALQDSLFNDLDRHGLQSILQATASPDLRASIRSFLGQKDRSSFLHLVRHAKEISSFLNEETLAAAGLYLLPEKLELRIRSALLQETRLHARIMRYIFLKYRAVPAGRTTDLRLLHEQRNRAFQEALKLLESVVRLNPDIRAWQTRIEKHASIRKQIRQIYEDYLNGATIGAPSRNMENSEIGDREAREASLSNTVTSDSNGPVEPKTENPVTQDSQSNISGNAGASLQGILKKAEEHYGKAVEWPAHIPYGNPFARREVLLHVKEQLLDRLRPVRSTTTGYSLIPGSRHGILPLNPVMKLWKDKPGFEANLPEIASLEINTPPTVECLLQLAALVDTELYQRELRLGRILSEKLGTRNLKNLKIFLMPGSCGAAREIERPDFPEFRNSVIGESRKPEELGVSNEPSILTGGWYKKRNHALYYPIGGDNGQLLRSIYLALRLPGPAAFFFALGQFVHDCLPDNLIYYAGSEIPFRQVTEDYYRQEDKVRKNRGEKTGRRKVDNSRAAVRFMFAVSYSRALMEALTASSQSNFRHPPTEKWMSRYLNLPVLSVSDRSRFKELRSRARSLIESWK
ncbi:MAG TPA: hypothetical protein DEA96_13675 [Leptospiraceae bacterium]|nr:hypothetical protein [Spirochaetaceae bacterium]HBS06011.1 hypothetical protein [Leptospiraceae bacterium]|tara:strand:- start:97462 stop:99936 length:2475 start_codon:yes stop_codon:yes gene_type:complete